MLQLRQIIKVEKTYKSFVAAILIDNRQASGKLTARFTKQSITKIYNETQKWLDKVDRKVENE